MGLYDEVVEVPRRTMVLFFVVDTSGSMGGAKIGTVNSAIEEIVPELKDISESNADAQIKVATLSFSTGARWIDSAPVAAENFRWNYLDANGVTDLGTACLQLNEKLSRNAFMSDATGSFAPAIFLLSDGEPTDNYKHGLEKLKQNNWFKKAIKVAVAIGDDANKTVLADFTGNIESVITVHTPEALKKWIQLGPFGLSRKRWSWQSRDCSLAECSETGITAKMQWMQAEWTRSRRTSCLTRKPPAAC